MTIIERVVELHRALDEAGVPHAFGGALALGWCTPMARGTVDIDLNLFVPPASAEVALVALPAGVGWKEGHLAQIVRDGQVRLFWDETPVDLFFNTTDFHAGVADRCRWEPFGGAELPFLSCRDLAVFKAFYNRTKDWADLEAMAEAGTFDAPWVIGVLRLYMGDDERLDRLAALAR